MPSSNPSSPKLAPKEPRRSRGRDRVASLLDAAAVVFGRVGFEAATMTEIAATAGASIGSLYQFFPTKAVVADALYSRLLDTLQDTLDATGERARAGATPIDVLGDQLLATLMAFVAEHPALPVVADRLGADAARKATATRPLMREQLADIMSWASPPPTPEQARYAAVLVLVMMKGAVAARVGQEADAEALIEDLRVMLRARLAERVKS